MLAAKLSRHSRNKIWTRYKQIEVDTSFGAAPGRIQYSSKGSPWPQRDVRHLGSIIIPKCISSSFPNRAFSAAKLSCLSCLSERRGYSRRRWLEANHGGQGQRRDLVLWLCCSCEEQIAAMEFIRSPCLSQCRAHTINSIVCPHSTKRGQISRATSPLQRSTMTAASTEDPRERTLGAVEEHPPAWIWQRPPRIWQPVPRSTLRTSPSIE